MEVVGLARKVREGEKVECRPLEGLDWKGRFPGPGSDPKGLNNFRLISCLRKGPWGVDELNRRIYEELAGEFKEGMVWPIPIMVTQTSYRLGIFNGETGVLLKRMGEEDVAVFEEREIPAVLIPRYEYGYCLSVHKSQGSEYREVALVVPKGSEEFGREILYTGLTRAREVVVIWGDQEAFEQCLSKTSMRASRIAERLVRY